MEKIKERNFSDLLKQSWKEYKQNFKLIFGVFIILAAIPSLIAFFNSNIIYLNKGITIKSIEQIKELGILAITLILSLSVIVNVLSALMNATFISSFLSKKVPAKTSSAIKEGSRYLLKLIGLMIVMALALIPLYILLIIPGIIFTVYWMFSAYILIGENKGIIESMKESFRLVKGRWWKIFKYGILMMLAMIGIAVLIAIPGSIILNLISIAVGKGMTYGLLSEFIDLGIGIITAPLMILLIKNFYTDLKSSKKDGRQK